MKTTLSAAALCVGLACQAQAQAQVPAPAAAAAAPGARPAAAEASVPQRGGEPRVLHLVDEDDRVRIEELRVRGVTKRLTVQPKLPGAPAYQIGTNVDGRDTTQDRRADGRALWQLFSF